MAMQWLTPKPREASLKLKRGDFAPPKDVRALTGEERAATDAFQRAYFDGWQNGLKTIDLSWFGYRTWKCPLDLWVYQEILFQTQPELIVECGTNEGGSALYLASLCDLAGRGRVVSIDRVALPGRPEHKRIEYILGSSTDEAVVRAVKEAAKGKRTMVILDSDHSRDHVLAEMKAYHDIVSVGCYLIVEDTCVNGHPILPSYGPGPMEAVRELLPSLGHYRVDRDKERLMMTLNPEGYSLRVA